MQLLIQLSVISTCTIRQSPSSHVISQSCSYSPTQPPMLHPHPQSCSHQPSYIHIHNHAATNLVTSTSTTMQPPTMLHPHPQPCSHQPSYIHIHNHAAPNLDPMLSIHNQAVPNLQMHNQTSPSLPSSQCTQSRQFPSYHMHGLPASSSSHQPPMVHMHTVIQFPTSHVMSLHLHPQSGTYEAPILSYSYSTVQFLQSEFLDILNFFSLSSLAI